MPRSRAISESGPAPRHVALGAYAVVQRTTTQRIAPGQLIPLRDFAFTVVVYEAYALFLLLPVHFGEVGRVQAADPLQQIEQRATQRFQAVGVGDAVREAFDRFLGLIVGGQLLAQPWRPHVSTYFSLV